MSSSFAFQGQSNVFNVTTNATPSTASAQVVSFAPVRSTAQDTGLTPLCPPQVRVVNTGTGIVYMSFTSALHTAVAPTAANPSIDFPVMPGEDVVFTLTQMPQPSQTSTLDYTLQINTVSTVASQVLNVQFGEGI